MAVWVPPRLGAVRACLRLPAVLLVCRAGGWLRDGRPGADGGGTLPGLFSPPFFFFFFACHACPLSLFPLPQCDLCSGRLPFQWVAFVCLLLGGVVAVGVSAYTHVSETSSLFAFDWDASAYGTLLSAPVAGMAGGGALVLASALIWCAFRSDRLGSAFKGLFLALVAAAIGACATAGTVGLLVGAGAAVPASASVASSAFAAAARDAWTATVTAGVSTLPCATQARFLCDGFDDRDCLRRGDPVRNARCATVCAPGVDGAPAFNDTFRRGCGRVVLRFYRRWFLTLGVGGVVAAALGGVAFVATACGVSFRLSQQLELW